MNSRAFVPADILLPKDVDYSDWSVIACDQFSSEKEYWDEVTKRTEGVPSTLHMIIPEAYLDSIGNDAPEKRNEVMAEYIAKGIFRCLENSYIYIEREITGGKIRRGLVGAIDLDAYEYKPELTASIKASERTVEDRLPPRIAVRRKAPIELPHVMVFIDDKNRSVVEPLTEIKDCLEKVYDFELMSGGGHIAGYRVSDEAREEIDRAFDALGERRVQIVIGDGNHSLAAAKKNWDSIKETLSPEERLSHPAKYALVELNNIYDEGIVFEPIHRVVFGIDADKLESALKERFGKDGVGIKYVYGEKEGEIKVPCSDFGELIGNIQSFLEEYVGKNGGDIDYIHDDASAIKLSRESGNMALLLPIMPKEELFKTVEAGKVFPKKSFSVGNARDKRYYLECRKIK